MSLTALIRWWRGTEWVHGVWAERKRIYLPEFFSSDAHSTDFQSKLTPNICFDAGCASISLAMGKWRGWPLNLCSVRVYSGAWKVNTFCIQNHRAHLVSLSLWWSVFLLQLSGYRPLHSPKQTCPGPCTRATTRPRPDSTQKRLFFFLRAPLWVLLVWFADNSHVGEHVVHVCSICPLIRLQGSALKHALSHPHPSCASTHSASPSDKEAILALISFHYVRADLVSGAATGSLMAPKQIIAYCLQMYKWLFSCL